MTVAGSLRVVEAGARVYRRTWRGSVISTFLNPVLYLLAMGVGLGELVDDGTGGTSLDIPYLTFLAPGLLAAAAMQAAAGDASYPVMAGIKWRKTYEATLSTPIGVPELLFGHLGWVTLRITFVSVVFAAVMTVFGATTIWEGMAAVGPAVLTGLTFAALITAYTARLKDEIGLASLFRFGIVPLFLFSGTFFPVEQLPDYVEPLAYLTPLWHGVELCRGLALGLEYTFPPLLSVAYLLALTAGGAFLSIRFLRRRLIS
jgi:lipooligosaccharide transport system permease protein